MNEKCSRDAVGGADGPFCTYCTAGCYTGHLHLTDTPVRMALVLTAPGPTSSLDPRFVYPAVLTAIGGPLKRRMRVA